MKNAFSISLQDAVLISILVLCLNEFYKLCTVVNDNVNVINCPTCLSYTDQIPPPSAECTKKADVSNCGWSDHPAQLSLNVNPDLPYYNFVIFILSKEVKNKVFCIDF